MKINDLRQYEGKQVTLNLINRFVYSGKITKINEDSFEFTDYKGNVLTVSPDFVGIIIPQQPPKTNNNSSVSDSIVDKPSAQKGNLLTRSVPKEDTEKKDYKKPFILTEKTALSWADLDVTENQRKVLVKKGIPDKEIDNMSKLDAHYVINSTKKENI